MSLALRWKFYREVWLSFAKGGMNSLSHKIQGALWAMTFLPFIKHITNLSFFNTVCIAVATYNLQRKE